MECPVCKVPMLVVEYEGVELDHCVECKGTWFDREELELLFERMLPDAAAGLPADLHDLAEVDTDEKPRRCPLCGGKMRKVCVGQKERVIIDLCPLGEGMWFDSLEVVRVAADLAGMASSEAIRFLGSVFGGSGVQRQQEKKGRQET